MTDTITRIGARGDGLTDAGRAVPLTAPGDVVDAAGALIAAGPHRATPPCRHFPQCGGCQLQHVDDPAYAAFLAERIVATLASQGLAAPAIAPARLSPPRTRRRASLKAERKGRQILIGFHEEASHSIVDTHECHVLHPALFALVKPLRALLAGLVPDRRAAGIVMTLTDRGIDLTLDRVKVDGFEATQSLTDFAQTYALARLSIDEGYGPETRYAPAEPTVTLGGIPVTLPPGAFLQATADGEAALVADVEAIVAGAPHVADLFAGLGTFALPLSATARVTAVEGARDAALALKGAAARARRPVDVDHRDLFRRPLTAAELDRFDAVILDPPRAGAREQVVQLAATARLATIAYVSCNPATFARDAAILTAAGWRLTGITPVGQFRWSTHVELVAAFTR